MGLKKIKGKNNLPCWLFDEYDAFGNRVRKKFYNQTEALEFASTFATRKLRGITDPSNHTFKEAVELYLKVRENCKDYNDLSRYCARVLMDLGDVRLSTFTPSTFSMYKNKLIILADQKKAGDGRGGISTANRMLAYLSAVLTMAFNEGWMERKFKIGIIPGEKLRKRYATQDELNRLFEAVKKESDVRWQLYFYTLIFTGMRRNDAISLRWSEIDLERGVIHDKTQSKTGNELWIPLADHLWEKFKNTQQWGSEWVFPSAKSKSGHLTKSNEVLEALA